MGAWDFCFAVLPNLALSGVSQCLPVFLVKNMLTALRELTDLRLWFSNHIVSAVPFHSVRKCFYRAVMKFSLGRNSAVHLGVRFTAKGGFKIGDSSVLGQECRIDTRGGVTLGENVSISPGVVIITADHDLQNSGFAARSSPVVIDDYVFVGTRAMILPGVHLGWGCAVAAGAVVTKDVPPSAIVAGVPARQIGERTRDLSYNTRYDRLFH